MAAPVNPSVMFSVPMRADEQFVADAVARMFGGSWVPVEDDPPDIILSHDGQETAVEISTLAEQVPARNDGLQPRHTADSAGVALCDRLDASLAERIPEPMTVILILEVPLAKFSKCEAALRKCIERGAQELRDREERVDILGNSVRIHYSLVPRKSDKKIAGIVANKQAQRHILSNVLVALEHRLKDKAKSCENLPHERLWLALLHDYWLASPETVVDAMGSINVQHPFKKVLLVLGSGEVRSIYERRT